MNDSLVSDLHYKIAILGCGGVGKTCTVIRFKTDQFDAEYVPTISDFFEKNIVVDGKDVQLTLIDTAGQEEMAQITDMAVKEADAYIIVYSIKSVISFHDTEKYYNKCKLIHGDSLKVVLIGNMCDVSDDERVVSKDQGEELALKWGVPFLETSAKEGINVVQTFETCVGLLLPKKGEKKGTGCCSIA